ncbi:MAG: 5'-methylthioadenosine/S-adenosylhomocysteine nucleosidase [Chloroflexota bacterium]
MKTVVLISADGEWRALKSLLQAAEPQDGPLGAYIETTVAGRNVIFFHGGWGRVSASATTQYVIDTLHPDLLVNLGTCGGFEGRIERGTVILVERTIIYDIVEQMTNSAEAIEHYSTVLDLRWLPAHLPTPATRGLLVSGDRDIVVEDIPALVGRYDAVAADWESGAIAWVADRNRQRLLILRGVSDLVGSEGGEAYGDYELFLSRTREIMAALLKALPAWLTAIENRLDAA